MSIAEFILTCVFQFHPFASFFRPLSFLFFNWFPSWHRLACHWFGILLCLLLLLALFLLALFFFALALCLCLSHVITKISFSSCVFEFLLVITKIFFFLEGPFPFLSFSPSWSDHNKASVQETIKMKMVCE